SASEKDALDSLGLGAVHNPEGKIQLMTLCDAATRTVSVAPQVKATFESDVIRGGESLTVTVEVVNPDPNRKYAIFAALAGQNIQPVNGAKATFVLTPNQLGPIPVTFGIQDVAPAGNPPGDRFLHVGVENALVLAPDAKDVQWYQQA